MLPGVLKLNFAKETFEYMYVHYTYNGIQKNVEQFVVRNILLL